MKHFCILLLFSVTAVLSAAAKPAATTTTTKPAAAKPAATTTTAKPAETKPAATTTTAKPAEAKPAATTTTAKPAEAKPAATTTTAKPATKPVSVLTSIYRSNPDPSAFADQERAQVLLSRRAELIQKIHDERKRLMEEDVAAKKLRDEILLLNRKLASVLEDKKSMIELNSQLNDLDNAISRLKPAPPPEHEDKTKADDNAAKDDKSGKDKKE